MHDKVRKNRGDLTPDAKGVSESFGAKHNLSQCCHRPILGQAQESDGKVILSGPVIDDVIGFLSLPVKGAAYNSEIQPFPKGQLSGEGKTAPKFPMPIPTQPLGSCT